MKPRIYHVPVILPICTLSTLLESLTLIVWFVCFMAPSPAVEP